MNPLPPHNRPNVQKFNPDENVGGCMSVVAMKMLIVLKGFVQFHLNALHSLNL